MGFIKCLSNKFVLASLAFISGLISVYDNVMNVLFYHTLPLDERNPVASIIIEHFGVVGLVETKAYGTILGVTVMLALIKTKYKFILYPILVGQLALFYFLTFHVNNSVGFWNGDLGLPFRMFLEFYRGHLTL